MKRLIKWKIYLQRASGYGAIVQQIMICYIFAKNVGLNDWYSAGFALGTILTALFVGKLDHRYILETEQEILYEKVPQLQKYFK